ncbi:MAG: hypothetical protein FWC91_01735 [Defluviitaleaceae bacterium]|nr:hypothetical protein [Defluviitaleaceae bacterium]
MNLFATGVVAGSVIGVISMGILMSDTKTRRLVIRGQRRAMSKTEDLLNGVTDAIH